MQLGEAALLEGVELPPGDDHDDHDHGHDDDDDDDDDGKQKASPGSICRSVGGQQRSPLR